MVRKYSYWWRRIFRRKGWLRVDFPVDSFRVPDVIDPFLPPESWHMESADGSRLYPDGTFVDGPTGRVGVMHNGRVTYGKDVS